MAKIQHGGDLTGQQMGEMLDEFCNSSNGRAEIAAFADHVTRRAHRTLQQKIASMFVACFEVWAADEHGHDGRNEATVKLAKKFVEATGDKYDRALPYI